MNKRNFRLLKEVFPHVEEVLIQLKNRGFPVLPAVLEERLLTALLRDLHIEDEEDDYLPCST